MRSAKARRAAGERSESRDRRPRSKIPGVTIDLLSAYGDARGWLTELFRSDELATGLRPAMAYVSATKPGQSRGPHEHRRQTDLFCFLGPGDFQIWLWDNRGQRRGSRESRLRRETWILGQSCPARLIVPPGVVHAYRNISKFDAVCFNAPNRLYRGRGKKNAVDEIRHEDDPGSPFRLE